MSHIVRGVLGMGKVCFAALLLCSAPPAYAWPVSGSEPDFNNGNIRFYVPNAEKGKFRAYMRAEHEDWAQPREREEGINPVHFFGTRELCSPFAWPEGETTFTIDVYTRDYALDCPVDSCAPCPRFRNSPYSTHQLNRTVVPVDAGRGFPAGPLHRHCRQS